MAVLRSIKILVILKHYFKLNAKVACRIQEVKGNFIVLLKLV